MDTSAINYNTFDSFIEEYDLYVFDFDLTILKIHSYAQNMTPSQVESMGWRKLMDQFADPIFFRDLINYLISQNKKVAIASFGKYNVIKAYLDRLFDNTSIFGLDNIITPMNEKKTRPSDDKNEYLVGLIRDLNIDYRRVIFFDDDINNINKSKELGVTAIQIDPMNGFNRNVWNQLAKPNKTKPIKNKKNEINNKNNMNQKVIEPFENETKKKVEKVEKVESENNNEDFMSYYINWLNMFVIIFIAIYGIIKKYS
jgi:FMN phosphatase YigB (HAD superfamily)